MKMYTKLFCPALLLACMALKSNAQHFMAMSTSDYSALNSIYLNPASISDCKEKVVVNMSSFALGFDNSLGTFSSFKTIVNNIGKSNGTNVFNNSGHENFNMLIPVLEVRGPGVMISLNDDHKQSFAFTTRLRWFNQLNNFDQNIFNTVNDPNSVSNGTYHYTSTKFNWTLHAWKEYGLSYGITVMQQDQSQVKVGATLRYLGGIVYLGLKGNNIDATFTTGSDSFYAKNSDLQFASNIISVGNAVSNGLSISNLANRFLGGGSGSGVGGDIGITYIYRIEGADGKPGPGENEDHKLSASLSITDIGSVKYGASNNAIVNVSGNGYLTGQGLSDNIGNFNSFKNYAKGQGYSVDTAAAATKVHMPTALIFSADYQIYKFCYVNATYIGNLVNRQLFGNSYYSQFTITPRVDMKIITFGLPITYSALAGDLKMGLGFRVGGFFFGSDDMLALLSNNQHGFGFYFGAYVPIFKKKDKKETNVFKRNNG